MVLSSMGKRLQHYRKEKNLTLENVADRLNVTPGAVCNWEKDKALPDIRDVDMMATLYDVSLDTIVRGTEPDEVVEKVTKKASKTFYDPTKMYTHVKTAAIKDENYDTARILHYVHTFYQSKKTKENADSLMYRTLETVCLLQALGFTTDDVLSTALLWGICDEKGFKLDDVTVSDTVKGAVSTLMVERDALENHDGTYFDNIVNNWNAVIVRLVDYYSRMFFTTSKLYSKGERAAFVDQADTIYFPLLEATINRYPEYDDELFLLKYGMKVAAEIVRNSLDRKKKN